MSKPIAERFWAKVDKTDGCWLWTAAKTRDGYGRLADTGGRWVLAHRFAYELHIGPIPNSLTLDHLCRVRHCVNPTHLEPVTNRVNALRGVGIPARNARKTHCLRGHPFDAENTRWWRGGRRCRTCGRAYRAVKHPHGPRLTDKERSEVRVLGASGLSAAEIARRFGVSRSTIARLLSGATWTVEAR